MKTFLRLCDTALEVKAAAGGDQVVTSVLLCVALLKRRLNQGRACKATLSLGWGLHRQQNTYILGPLINMRTLRNLFWGCDGWDHHLFFFLRWSSVLGLRQLLSVSALGGCVTTGNWPVQCLLRGLHFPSVEGRCAFEKQASRVAEWALTSHVILDNSASY